ncbi:hypothetical protein JDV02_010616 [Purpureocillium takamizusanense]|uniref:Uncharacterized protein n=1 Tax=Purpureocillium takamizusanense TaxID=2060973 RepID=A0A9Q8QT19_9HYPO|nr:uncharacterized protein JDV02_010616 [Purpureocillium takamizusanense]UNI24897.1 hypothetical protein JDV02_010616 [Purpureocillium takamizusanense]
MAIRFLLLLLCCLASAARTIGRKAVLANKAEKIPEHLLETQKRIEEAYTVDFNHPPYYIGNTTTRESCGWDRIKCFYVYYGVRHTLYPMGDPMYKAWYTTNIEAVTTTGALDADLSVDEIHSHMQAVTDGWSASITANGQGFTPVGFFGGSIAYGEEHSNTKMRTVTLQQGKNHRCPKFHRCQIQTLTWHLTIEGMCTPYPTINCAGQIQVCDLWSYTCDAYEKFANEWCPRKDGVVRLAPCSLNMPVMLPDGKTPFSETRIVETPLRPRVVYWTPSCKVATLNNGFLWSPVDKLFIDPTDYKEFQYPPEMEPISKGECVPKIKTKTEHKTVEAEGPSEDPPAQDEDLPANDSA